MTPRIMSGEAIIKGKCRKLYILMAGSCDYCGQTLAAIWNSKESKGNSQKWQMAEEKVKNEKRDSSTRRLLLI